MLKLGNKVLLTEAELYRIKQTERDEAWETATEHIRASFEDGLETRNTTIKNQKRTIKSLTDDKEELKIRVEVLEEDRDDVREIVKQEMHLKDLEAVLEQRQENQDAREAKLKDRSSKLDSAEETNYKSGYADGVADGVRKISEITQKDRDAAMKIAMVSAASHTPIQNIKEVNRELRLTAGDTDSED